MDKYKIINKITNENNYGIQLFCKIANISKSGFYAFLKRENISNDKDLSALSLIKKVFFIKKKVLGARQTSLRLRESGVVMNLKKIRRIMHKYGLVCKIRRRNKARVTLTKNIENMCVKNTLNRKFKQDIPYTYASTDITYLKHNNKFSFLSVVKDIATGEALCWKLSKYMNLELVINTITELELKFKKNKLDLKQLLLHSDQGFQYTNSIYHKMLKTLKIKQSMSRKGNSVDNAPIESFFGHMKDEIDCKNINFNQLHNLINEYMIDYNYKRKQWNKRKMTPIEYKNYLLNKNFAL
jgi:putative transposase